MVNTLYGDSERVRKSESVVANLGADADAAFAAWSGHASQSTQSAQSVQIVYEAPQPVALALCSSAAGHSATHATNPWYVCLTKPRQERVAQARLAEQGYEVYLPQLRSWQQRAGQWQQVDSIMFPRYAFLRPGNPGQSVAPARSTPGVTTLVSFGPVLGYLAADRLEALRVLVDARAQATPAQPLQVNAAVIFSSGPLKGMSGLVSAVAAERVMVLMSLLGREKRVSVPVHQLTPA